MSVKEGEEIITDENGKKFVARWVQTPKGPEPVMMPIEDA